MKMLWYKWFATIMSSDLCFFFFKIKNRLKNVEQLWKEINYVMFPNYKEITGDEYQ